MKVWKNKKGVSPVIATILMVAITVVLAAVLYVMVMGMMNPTGNVAQPLSIYARYIDAHNISVTVSGAPPNAKIAGSTIVIQNASTGLPTGWGSGANISVYNAAGTVIAGGTAGTLTGDSTLTWGDGQIIRIYIGSDKWYSSGDKIQISGTGFGTTTMNIGA